MARPGRPRRRRRHRRLQGLRAAAAVHRVRATASGSCRPPAALRFVGAPTWAALSGQPVATEVWDDVHEVPHVRHRPAGRPGRGGARPPPTCWPGPPTASPTTCSPTPCSPPAARWCSRRPCTPRCGSTRPPGQRRARCARRGARRDRAGGRAAHRRRHRQGPAARPGRDLRGRAARAAPAAAAPPTWPAGTWWSPPAAPASRSTRCASSATGRPASRGTRSPAPRSPAGARVTLDRGERRAARPGRRRRGPGRHHRGAAQGHRSRRPPAPTWW